MTHTLVAVACVSVCARVCIRRKSNNHHHKAKTDADKNSLAQ